MLLCLDVGNSNIYGGVFDGQQLVLTFRHASAQACTSDQLGVFLRAVFRENRLDPDAVSDIAICSVVPRLNYSLHAACSKYFDCQPFILQAGVRTGLSIRVSNPASVGSDRIANALGARDLFPKKPLVIVGFGTATTCCAISAEGDFLGGVILPGINISMEALSTRAAMLSPVDIVMPSACLGQTTTHNIQAGLYYGQLGAVKEVVARLIHEAPALGDAPVRIATGGFSHLFAAEHFFDAIVPDLILQGLRIAFEKNAAIPSPV